jgi:hypothetical protein
MKMKPDELEHGLYWRMLKDGRREAWFRVRVDTRVFKKRAE